MSSTDNTIDLKNLAAEFKEWRTVNQGKQKRIPDHLWEAASQAVDHYPISQVCRILGLNAALLKKKREALQAKEPKDESPSFIPLSLVPDVPKSTRQAFCLQFSDSNHHNLQVEFEGDVDHVLNVLVSTFLKGQR